MLGYIAVYPRRTLVHNISQCTPIYSNILLFRPGISSGIYWNILEYTGDVSTGRIYRNISQYIPIFSNISGPYIAIYWLIFHISAVNLIVSILSICKVLHNPWLCAPLVPPRRVHHVARGDTSITLIKCRLSVKRVEAHPPVPFCINTLNFQNLTKTRCFLPTGRRGGY